MRILVLHNLYQQPGGEDAVVVAEADLLRQAGHHVRVEYVDNASISSVAKRIKAFSHITFSEASRKHIRVILKEFAPEIVHIHNFFPLLTYAAHKAAFDAGAGVVQTIHNYRPVCSGAYLSRRGVACEKCVIGSRLWGIYHRCYRGSLLGSIAVHRMQEYAFREEIWTKYTHQLIALTNFSRGKLIEAGFPSQRLAVKPNFIAADQSSVEGRRSGALFVGRLSPEKGVHHLLAAWEGIPEHNLIVVGDGPERKKLEGAAPNNVRFLGFQDKDQVEKLMRASSILVIPSIWYEGFPMALLEAFGNSLPVFCSRLGSLQELVDHGVTGELFEPGNPISMRQSIREALARPEYLRHLGTQALEVQRRRYSPKANLEQLHSIYSKALAMASMR